jgi:hypothetical protein
VYGIFRETPPSSARRFRGFAMRSRAANSFDLVVQVVGSCSVPFGKAQHLTRAGTLTQDLPAP